METKTKFFTEQATGGSKGEASVEDMRRGFTDSGADDMPDDTFFMPEAGGGFLGRAKGWER